MLLSIVPDLDERDVENAALELNPLVAICLVALRHWNRGGAIIAGMMLLSSLQDVVVWCC